MKLSRPNKNFGFLQRTIREYLRTIQEWLTSTPERALEQANQAALKIKMIEDDHFSGKKISSDTNLHSESVMACLLADLEKYLNTVRLRFAEFKMSRSVLGNLDSTQLAKLGLIDEILNRYASKPEIAMTSISDSELSKTESKPIENQPKISEETYPLNSSVAANKNGVLPRSIGITVNRLKAELNPNYEQEVITQFRRSSYNTKLAIKFVLLLILIPLLTQKISKQFFITPIVEKIRTPEQSRIFLNSEMREEALRELDTYEEELRFASLIKQAPQLSQEAIEKRVQQKATEIAEEFWRKSNNAIANVFADFLALIAFSLLLITSKKEITVLKSFMDEIAYGLSDSAKAFLIILFTDIFVGYHSSHGWEILLEGLANHLGIAANRGAIFLFIATFPVILDTVFKYWIFRYLSRISPSAVATLKNMNE
ncbi:MAG: proton extrusion protein PcxA [Iphinoe sp. HA4291-MV1]|nr:proton extrusion protein PcxA [Iphinoe sp. HA4291-MV1]